MNDFHAEESSREWSREWSRRLVVITPEHVELRYETAGIGSRTGAQLIDVLILVLINAALALSGWYIIGWIDEGDTLTAWLEEYVGAVLIILFALLNGGYFLIGEYVTGGRTVGKRVMGIRVIQDNGRPLSFLASAIRNLLRIIDMLPTAYFLGALVSFFHSKDKRLGDIAAGTAVVYEADGLKRREKRMAKLLSRWQPAMPELGLEPWVRERVTEEEWTLVSSFAERLVFLSAKRSEALAAQIVEHLAPKLGLAERWEEWKASLLVASSEQLPPMKGPLPKSVPVAWVLAIYQALRPDWELGHTDGDQ